MNAQRNRPLSDQILVAQNHQQGQAGFCRLLREAGFALEQVQGWPQALIALREEPALLLLEVGLIDAAEEDSWASFGQSCRAHNVPCLLVADPDRSAQRLRNLAPWASGILRWPADDEEVLAQVSGQLTIRRLQRDLEAAQDRLLRKEMELEKSLRSAAHIQESLIPARPPRCPDLGLAWKFLPCRRVGGDLFSVMQLDEETVMAYILDVSGHGISSAMVTVSVYQSLSHHTGRLIKQPLPEPPYYTIPGPAAVLAELDAEYPFERFEMFFTIVYLLINPRTGLVRYSNAGHPPPLLVRSGGELVSLDAGGTIIGMDGLVPFTEGELQLAPGDRLFLYTDGIPECPAPTGEVYGDARFRQRLVELQGGLEEVCQGVIAGLQAFGDGLPQKDDITLIGLEYRGGGVER